MPPKAARPAMPLRNSLCSAALLGLALVAAASGVARAEDRHLLGVGHFMDNDVIGDGKDRWRSGSYELNFVRGPGWEGRLPGFGEILEYRFHGEVIAPASTSRQAPDDRRYAGVLSFGLGTPFALGTSEGRLALDLVAIGPMTGVDNFQNGLHNLFDASEVTVNRNQLGNHVYPTLSGEIGHSFGDGASWGWRPFVSARAGDETFLRAGWDFEFGNLETGALWSRDQVTGQRYVSVKGKSEPGLSFVIGADAAWIADSHYLPADGEADMSRERYRVRAGVRGRGENFGMFYGVTWLSEEFRQQDEGQLIGSIRVRFVF